MDFSNWIKNICNRLKKPNKSNNNSSTTSTTTSA